jgi:hypothetical protein
MRPVSAPSISHSGDVTREKFSALLMKVEELCRASNLGGGEGGGEVPDNVLTSDDIGDTVQGYNPNLDAWAGVSPSAYVTISGAASTAGAGMVGILDTAGHFTATTVEEALAELAARLDVVEVQPRTGSIIFEIGDGVAVIGTGRRAFIRVPYACTLTRWTALSDVVGSIQIDVWRDTYVNYPPTNGDSITAAAPIFISANDQNEDASLSGWTVSMSSGDILILNVDSVSTMKYCLVAIDFTVP